MSDPLVFVDRDDDVVTLRFNNPDSLNAMTQAMGEAFAAEVAVLARDSSVRAVVLAGAGRAFSAGGDLDMITARADRGREEPVRAQREIRDGMRSFYKLFLSVRDLPCPTLAAVHGHAIGAGFCVALACDIRFAGLDAKLGLNFTRLGLHPGMGATWTLPRLVGPAVAAELLYTSRLVTGEEAVGLGLANRALPSDQVLDATRECARQIAANAPHANRGVKQALGRSLEATLEDQLSFEATEQATCFTTEDVHEGIAAVKEKRAPKFTGR
ncbi:MAG: enoyl-CoA hydratase-related protein [Proteobacteria bacterium]|nr:enoyl-CoA hydratase-related protein [Pseudomonadota bacterium]